MSAPSLSDSARTHSRLAPSASDRWLACGGSVALIGEEKRNDDTQASREGTAAHSLLEVCLKKGVSPHRLVGKAAPNGITWTAEMADNVDRSLDYIRNRPKTPLEVRHVEAELEIPVIKDKGHIDVGFVAAKEIEVIDYKNGFGYVEAVDNSQMRLYGLGLYYSVPSSDRRRIERYRGTIIQPRAGNGEPRTEILPIADLLKWEKGVVAPQVRAIRAGTATLNAGAHCKWCPAASKCPTLAKDAINAAAQDFAAFLDPEKPRPAARRPSPNEMTLKQLKTAYDRLDIIIMWVKTVEKAVLDAVIDGHGDELGLKLVEGKTNRAWIDEEKARKVLGRFLLSEDITVERLISVAEAEKLLKAKFASVAKGLVTKPPGKPTLAPLDDPRPAVRNSAAEDFKEHLE